MNGTLSRLSVGLALLAATAMLTACGGGGGESSTTADPAAPQPSNDIDQLAAKWEAAVKADDCKALKELGTQLEPTNFDCSQVSSEKLLAKAQYGPAGTIDTHLPNATHGSQSCAVQDEQGELRVISCFDLPPAVGTAPGQGQHSEQAEFDRAVDGTLDGLRTKDCDEFFKYASTGRAAKSDVCGQVFGPQAGAVLKAIETQKDAEPSNLGGNGTWQFYGLALKPDHYVTIAVGCYQGKCLSQTPVPAE